MFRVWYDVANRVDRAVADPQLAAAGCLTEIPAVRFRFETPKHSRLTTPQSS